MGGYFGFMRIVSLLPSATEIVALLGAGDSLVGRSHECDWPVEVVRDVPALTASNIGPSVDALRGSPRGAPGKTLGSTPGVLPGTSAEIDGWVGRALEGGGSLYRLDSRRLRELAPEVIITQSLCSVCSIDGDAVRAAAADIPGGCRVLTLNAASFEDMFDDIARVGEAVGREVRARGCIAGLRERFFRVSDHVNAFADPVRTLFLEWTDPMFVAGHWTAQMVERAGGVCALNPTRAMPGAGAGAGGQMAHRLAGPGRRVTREEVEAFNPAAAVVCPCGFDLERVREEYRALCAQAWWCGLDAVRNGRVALVDGNQMFNRPGPRLVDAYEWLVGWLQGVDGVMPAGFPWEVA